MGQSNGRNIYEVFDGFKNFASTFLGVFVAIIGIAVVFVISSLEGTKEIQASNRVNATLISIWREDNDKNFPESKVDTIIYEDIEYYFIIDKTDDLGNILEWHFAYDGGFGYIFNDYKFYILTLITMMVSIFVAQVNYTTSINSAMNGDRFIATLLNYQESKDKIKDKTQYIPMFCSYKNKQLYDNTKRELIESANINYDFYNSNEFDKKILESWQLEILDEIKKIRVDNITPSDLLQEKTKTSKKVSLLPISPENHKKNYLYKSIIQKTISSILSGFVMALGVVLGNWFLGITYGFTVLLSFIMANITGGDYANNGLRQRYIAKSDLLNEFYNMIGYFEEEEKRINKKEEKVIYPIVVKSNEI